MSERIIKIGLCGYGVVGQGVYRHLAEKKELLRAQLGATVEVVRIAMRDTSKVRDIPVDPGIVVSDPLAVANDPEVEIVCELMGGKETALAVALAALKAGKTVVTANKALLCDHGAEIFAAAEASGAQVLFEASVAGGIPVIKAVKEGLAVNEFRSLYGILNGTCNYILTRMSKEGGSYEDILREAKALGYAEADESLDVDGIDATHKAVVLAYLAYGRWVPFKDVLVRGISEVTQDDIRFAKENGYAIKLIAVIDRAYGEGKLYISVLPTLVSKKYTLGSVDGVFNAVAIQGDVVGETVYIGPGAGRDATASAVIADIVDASKALLMDGCSKRFPFLKPTTRDGSKIELAEPNEIHSRYYVRLSVRDEPGVMAAVATIFAQSRVSLASVTQKEVEENATSASLIITTHMTTEEAILASVENLEKLASVEQKPFCMPIGTFEE